MTDIQTTADGSPTLYSERYGESFHSNKGALTEANHVFLQGTGVAKRLEHHPTHLLEVGFGTGLNFFLTADVALKHKTALHYTALEKDLLSAEAFASLGFEKYLEQPALFERFLAWRRLEESETFEFEEVRFELLFGEATEQTLPENTFHAVYQDAFSPDKNPELWSEAFLGKLRQSLTADGVLSTYCVKGAVRRRMQALGFSVEKRLGPPGGKREMLVARKALLR